MFSLENLSILIFEHDKTLNNKVLNHSSKDHFMALGPMKPHFKKKSHNQKKGSHDPKKNFKKSGNKKHYDPDKINKIQSQILW